MTDLNNLEQKIFMSYFQDGIVDIFIGLIFIFDGVLMLMNKTQFIGLAVIFPIFIPVLKKQFITPRSGYVKFKVTREKKIKKSVYLFLIGGISVFNVLLIIFSFQNRLSLFYDYLFIIIGAFIALLPISSALITGVKRFYLYGILIFALFVHEHFTHSSAPMDFTIFGIILLFVGLYYLVDFIKKHPLPDYGVSDDQKE